MSILFLSVLALGSAVPAQDTLVDLRRGDTVVLEDLSGRVSVESWDRPFLRVESQDRDPGTMDLRRSGDRLVAVPRKGRSAVEELEVSLVVPSWINLEISGRELEVRVEGLQGGVVVRTLDGDLVLEDLGGEVTARSVGGTVEGSGLRGRTRIRTGDGDIRLQGCSGELNLETVDGDIRMEAMEARLISLKSTDGDVEFDGRLLAGGRYDLVSHSGDLELLLRSPVDADVVLQVYDGEFESDFPVRARGFRSDEALEFTLGRGGSALTLESFSGDITLSRHTGG